jgi:hypothetical protein
MAEVPAIGIDLGTTYRCWARRSTICAYASRLRRAKPRAPGPPRCAAAWASGGRTGSRSLPTSRATAPRPPMWRSPTPASPIAWPLRRWRALLAGCWRHLCTSSRLLAAWSEAAHQTTRPGARPVPSAESRCPPTAVPNPPAAAAERLIGDAAKNQVALNPKGTLFDAKRLIGRKYDDPTVQVGCGLLHAGSGRRQLLASARPDSVYLAVHPARCAAARWHTSAYSPPGLLACWTPHLPASSLRPPCPLPLLTLLLPAPLLLARGRATCSTGPSPWCAAPTTSR